VTEPLRNDVGPHAGVEELRGVTVPVVVQPDLREAERRSPTACEVTPTLRETIGMDGGAVDLTEHEVGGPPARPERESTFELLLPVSAENVNERVVELDRAASGSRLRLLVVDAVESFPDRAPHCDLRVVEVDVIPSRRDEFTATKAGHRSDVPNREVIVVGDRVGVA